MKTLVTDAAPGYDYPTTQHIGVLGTDIRTGRQLRLVEAKDAKWLGFQTDRYLSGNRMAMSEADFEKIRGIALAAQAA